MVYFCISLFALIPLGVIYFSTRINVLLYPFAVLLDLMILSSLLLSSTFGGILLKRISESSFAKGMVYKKYVKKVTTQF